MASAGLAGLLLGGAAGATLLQPKEVRVGGFELAYELVLPGSPEVVFDAMTGDISDWWDHHVSPNPRSLVLEPKPGGHFVEVFDDAGNGAVFARVLGVERGKRIVFSGPFGFIGEPLEMVTTYDYEAVGDSTRVNVKVAGAGRLDEEWPALVDGAWKHFLFERLEPHVKAGGHLGG
jgi:uncharacterized protein YndB with AHSA1/START domain